MKSPMIALLFASGLLACSQDAMMSEKAPSPSGALPEELQGLWLADLMDCGRPNWTEGYNLTDKTVSVNNGRPINISKVEERGDGDVFVQVVDSEAGWASNGKFLFKVDPMGKTLSNAYDNRTASFELRKCS